MSLVSKLNMAASGEVDVALNKATLTAKAAKPNRPRPSGEEKEMVKLRNTQVIEKARTPVFLRHLFNGLSHYHKKCII